MNRELEKSQTVEVEKDQVGKNILVYDVNATPKFLELEKVVYLFQNHKIVLYDSHYGAEPKIFNPEGKLTEFLDTSSPENKQRIEEVLKQCEDGQE